MEVIPLPEVSAYELERGKPMPSKNHGLIQSNLTGMLFMTYRKEYSFPTELTIHLQGKDYVPDICIYPKMIYNGLQDEIRVSEVPITAIEILSPKQGSDDIREKFEVYFTNEVKSCWFVQPFNNSISVYTPEKKIYVFHDEVLTDPVTQISVDLKEVFA